MNKFILTGRLTKDPELKFTKDNKGVLDLSLAIRNGVDDTTFINVTVFGKTAENTNKYCSKGKQIAVEGMIKNNNWEDQEGKKHYDYTFIGNHVEFLGNNNSETNGVHGVENNAGTASQYTAEMDKNLFQEENNLPF